MKKNITLKDIAKESGFSTKTVSRVINNENYVKEDTKNKILEILKKHKFNINMQAKKLVTSKTNQILLITNILHINYPLQKNSLITNSIIRHSRKKGYNVIVVNNVSELDKTVYGTYEKGYFDGVIILSDNDSDFLKELINEKKPVIISGISNKYDYVGTDLRKGSNIATNHLIELGCKKISLLLDDKKTKTNEEKLQGYLKALKDKNMDYSKIYYDVFTSDKVEKIIEEDYLNNKLNDAYMINSDYASLGAIRVINKYNLKVPDDIKIISFGDTYICNEIIPRITAVKQDFEKIGIELVETIISKINNEIDFKITKIPARLVIRETTVKEVDNK